MLLDREQAAVLVSTEDRDNFIKNMVTILAEVRAGLAVLDFDVAEWPKIEPGSGQLRLFMTPKRLVE